MSLVGWIILAGVVIIAVVFFFIGLAKQYRKVGPNEVLIISGGRRRTITEPDGTKRKIGYRMNIGGGALVMPFLERADILPLEVFTLNMEIQDGLTAKGIELKAVGQAQVKVKSDESSIRIASEQFLSKGLNGMKEIAQQIIEGNMRNVLGAMTVEDIYQNRGQFSSKVMEKAGNSFNSMGLQVLSFSLKEIADNQGYLEALGKPHVARVKGEAEVAQAEAESVRLGTQAKGKALAIKHDGLARAEVAEALGNAEAKAMEKKAAAFAQYNQAAVYKMFIDILPELAKSVAEPLSKVDKIIMVGNGADGASKITGQVANVLAQLPDVVKSLSGVDLTKYLQNIAEDKLQSKSKSSGKGE